MERQADLRSCLKVGSSSMMQRRTCASLCIERRAVEGRVRVERKLGDLGLGLRRGMRVVEYERDWRVGILEHERYWVMGGGIRA